jgi:hypothetical protein
MLSSTPAECPCAVLDTQYVDTYLDQCFGALNVVATHPNRRTYPQAPLVVFARVGIFDLLHDVF